MAAIPLSNPYDRMPLPRLRPSRQSPVTIDGALAQPSLRPIINIGTGPKSDALTQALLAGANKGQSTPFEALGNLAQLWSGNRAEDKYLSGQEDKKKAEADARRQQLMGLIDPNSPNADIARALINADVPVDQVLPLIVPKQADPGDILAREKWDYERTHPQGAAPGDVLAREKWEYEKANPAGPNPSDALAREKFEWEKANTAPDAPDLEIIFDEETGRPYKARWNPKTQTYDRVGGVEAPSGTSLSVDPETGAVSFTQGNMKPLTEGQSKDTVFVTRANGALPLIDKFGPALTSLPERAAGGIPGGLGNYLKTPEYQQAEQAGKEFLQAILRKDTGAAITKEETEEYGSVYLPRPGDGPELLEQKRASRNRAVIAIQAGMPPAAILALEKAGVNLADPSAAVIKPLPQEGADAPVVIDGVTIRRRSSQ